MSEPVGAPVAPALVMRVSIPAAGDFRGVARELAAKIAEYLGSSHLDAASASRSLEEVASAVVPPAGGPEHDIEFEFRQGECELLIQARCDGRTSEARHPLPD